MGVVARHPNSAARLPRREGRAGAAQERAVDGHGHDELFLVVLRGELGDLDLPSHLLAGTGGGAGGGESVRQRWQSTAAARQSRGAERRGTGSGGLARRVAGPAAGKQAPHGCRQRMVWKDAGPARGRLTSFPSCVPDHFKVTARSYMANSLVPFRFDTDAWWAEKIIRSVQCSADTLAERGGFGRSSPPP